MEQDTGAGRAGNGIDRREALRRVSALLGGVALVGGSSLMAACEKEASRTRTAAAGSGGKIGEFTAADVAYLDEIADTILPTTAKSPGAKAAKVGAFMALMVTDTYDGDNQRVFREGMRKLDDASKKMHDVGFMQATPAQRLALLEPLDREQYEAGKQREATLAARTKAAPQRAAAEQAAAKGTKPGPKLGADTSAEKRGDAYLSDQRQENAPGGDEATPAPGITEEAPPHFFRMMKELALLGYFTSEIGCTQAQRYEETPGKWEPCIPYKAGDPAWAPHA